eukprot:GHVU01233333.1.p3 GENE.GHVU01233333.1~~GHVU01233333.1.p3  ORF type:complete len:121 (-),score=30.94 GHVU01233333.1:247-576(-)
MRSPERVFEEFDRNVMEVGELERSNEERTNQLQVLEEAGAWLCECEKITEGIYQTIAAEREEREERGEKEIWREIGRERMGVLAVEGNAEWPPRNGCACFCDRQTIRPR